MFWTAFEIDSIPSRGTTKPSFLRCRTGDASSDKCAVLLVKSGLPYEQLVSEYVGNRIAGQLGIATPRPAVVEISDEFLESVKSHPERTKTILKSGLATGNQKLLSLAESIKPPFQGADLRAAETLFALDVIGRQFDRNDDNPNAARSAHGLVAFDFQLTFHMAWEAEVPVKERRLAAIEANRKNPFRHAIQKRTEFDAIFDRFDVLDKHWFQQVETELPKDWHTYCRKIRDRVTSELKHRDRLKQMMMEASK